MDSQQYSDKPPREPKRETPSQSPIETRVKQTEVTNHPESEGKREKNTAGELAREFKTFEKLSLLINGALALIGIGALYVYHGQLKVMQGQLVQTDKLITEAQKQNLLARQQLVGTQAAILYIFTPSLGEHSLSISFRNEGKVICPKLTVHFVVSLRDFSNLSRSLWRTGEFAWTFTQIIPEHESDSGSWHITELNKITFDQIQRLTKTIQIEGAYRYDNGFGDPIEQPFCRDYWLGPEWIDCGDIVSRYENYLMQRKQHEAK